MVPNTTCRPSKKLSPMMMTVAPPVVHPSLGLIALMHGVAAYPRQREEQVQQLGFSTQAHVSFQTDTLLHHLCVQPSMSPTKTYHGNCLWKKKWWICPLRPENQNHLSVHWSGVVKQTLQMVHFTKAKCWAHQENDLMEQIMCQCKCSYQNWLSMQPYVQ